MRSASWDARTEMKTESFVMKLNRLKLPSVKKFALSSPMFCNRSRIHAPGLDSNSKPRLQKLDIAVIRLTTAAIDYRWGMRQRFLVSGSDVRTASCFS